MKKVVSILLLMMFNLLLFAQAIPKPKSQWEYLVISPGKTYFNESSITDVDIMKIQRYNISPSEAGLTQDLLDTLGKSGWELVSIIGSIGGDQQYVLKRPFDLLLIQYEEGIAKKRIEKEKKEIAIASVEKLVELDAFQQIIEDQTKKSNLEEIILTSIIKSLLDIKPIALENYWYKDTLWITIKLDQTKFLVNKNQYRKSDLLKYSNELKNKIIEAVNEDVTTVYDLSITIESQIMFNKQMESVVRNTFYWFKDSGWSSE